MKDFFKFMFASMLGFFLTLVIAFFLFLVMIASILSFVDSEVVTIKEKSVLHIKLELAVYDRTPNDPFSNFSSTFEFKQPLGLNDILKNLKKAAKDDKIEGIFIDIGNAPVSITILEELRNAILEFKDSGKWVISYSESYPQTAYYFASVADKVYLHPDGMIEFKGIGAEVLFLKGTLEKLDIETQIIRQGKYKSAIEPLILDKMSKANREQIETFINSIWASMVSDISESRGLTIEKLNKAADKLDALNADKALALKIVDGLYYRDQVLKELRDELDLQGDAKINLVTIGKYDNTPALSKSKRTRDKIAVVYAIGSIQGGKGDDLTIGSDRISEAIRKARTNDKVKAVVLRVNSPGGSAIASEVIRREIELTSAVKPVVVSMGEYAASGGYWISCSADKIVADPTTLTGSIGVFGIIPNLEMFFKNKLGMTFDYAMTNKNADFPSITKPLTGYQKEILEREIGKIYDRFLQLVAEGRNMTVEQVDEIAQGRIWSAIDAKKIGLVDELGGFERALELAAEIAGIEDYRIYSLPEQKDPFKQLIKDLTGNTRTKMIKAELGSYYSYFEYLKAIADMEGAQARLPFEIIVN